MKSMVLGFLKDENGQGMAEYGLILALIAVVVISTLGFLGGAINDKFNEVKDGIKGTAPTTP